MSNAGRDYSRLVSELSSEYAQRSHVSASLSNRAQRVMVDGGSHGIRLIKPFPLRLVSANGAWITDEDGHHILDFWQGHFANILGHNPPLITEALSKLFARAMACRPASPIACRSR